MRALLLLALLALTACTESIEVPGDSHQIAFEWRIVTEDQLRAIYADAGMPLGKSDVLHGFVGIDHATGQSVVYTLRPQRLDDAKVCTLGHEVVHLAVGSYHR